MISVQSSFVAGKRAEIKANEPLHKVSPPVLFLHWSSTHSAQQVVATGRKSVMVENSLCLGGSHTTNCTTPDCYCEAKYV